MDVYYTEKQLFSSLQSKFHKLLNSLKSDKNNIDNDKLYKLKEINELFEILENKIIDYNDNNYYLTHQEKQNIDKNNKVISDLIPIFILYRMLIE